MQPNEATDPVVAREPDASKGARPVLRGEGGREASFLPSSTPAPVTTATGVVQFWRDAGAPRWFKKDEAFDADFRARFMAAHEAAARGKPSWRLGYAEADPCGDCDGTGSQHPEDPAPTNRRQNLLRRQRGRHAAE